MTIPSLVVVVTIADDGPGFSAEIMDTLGDPYVTTRSAIGPAVEGDVEEASGLGLGFFIAKTLLERSGAKLALENRTLPEHGAIVRITWPRELFDLRVGGSLQAQGLQAAAE